MPFPSTRSIGDGAVDTNIYHVILLMYLIFAAYRDVAFAALKAPLLDLRILNVTRNTSK